MLFCHAVITVCACMFVTCTLNKDQSINQLAKSLITNNSTTINNRACTTKFAQWHYIHQIVQ